MRRTLARQVALVAVLTLGTVPAARAGSVGDVLKAGGQKAVELFNKAKDTVTGWFGKSDVKKIPYLMEKLGASQAAVKQKQESLLSMYGEPSASGSGKSLADSFLRERASDLVQAKAENDKYFKDLQELLTTAAQKKTDLSAQKAGLDAIHQTQAALDQNQATLQGRMARFWPTEGTPSASGQTPALSGDTVETRYGSPTDPYAAAGAGKDGVADTTAYGASGRAGDVGSVAEAGTSNVEKAASSPTAGAGAAASNPAGDLNPNAGDVRPFIDEWLGKKGYDSYGRLLLPGMTASGPVETGGSSREQYLWGTYPELQEYVRARLRGEAPTVARVAETQSTSESRPSDAAGLTRDARSGAAALQKALTSGANAGQLKSQYETYVDQDAAARDKVSQQHQATENY